MRAGLLLLPYYRNLYLQNPKLFSLWVLIFALENHLILSNYVISLVMSNNSDNLPVFIQALSGNTSGKNHSREIVR